MAKKYQEYRITCPECSRRSNVTNEFNHCLHCGTDLTPMIEYNAFMTFVQVATMSIIGGAIVLYITYNLCFGG